MRHVTIIGLCAASMLLVATVPARAAVLHVPGDHATIQSAIDAAANGDEIVVAAGTWTGEGNKNLDILGKTLTLRSADGPETCIIDAEGSGRGVVVRRQSDVVLEGFTIRRGLAEGGGILCLHSDLQIVRCVIEDNEAPPGKHGGGLYGASSTILVEESEFRWNQASDGSWEEDGGEGGGLFVDDSSLTLVECTVTSNRAGYPGGNGGGLFANDSSLTLVECAVTENWARYGDSGGDGGGICARGSTVKITDCEISGNHAGGSDWVEAGSGGGLFVEGTLSLVRSLVARNVGGEGSVWGGRGGSGGGVYVAGEAMLAHSTIEGNGAGRGNGECGGPAGHGGGVFATGGPVEIVGCLIVGNRAGDSDCEPEYCVDGEFGCFAGSRGGNGGGVHAYGATITNCTIISNRAGMAYRQHGEGGGVTGGVINNSIVWNNWPDAAAGATSVTYSNIEGGHAGVGNIDVDPLCVDPEDGDYRLGPGSPCIDAADNSAVPEDVTEDLDGNPRFVDDPDTGDTGYGEPPIVDMGAYEFQGASCPADLDDSGVVDFGDVLAVLRAWGNPGGREDLDGSGVVDFGDVLLVLAAWGPCGR